ncbi:MAG: T9SS type A sorting domain-containing protein [bacterium]
MFKKYVTLVLVIALMPMLLFAQEKQKKAPVKFDQGTAIENVNSNLQHVTPQTAQQYIYVDVMGNCYGPAIGALNPVAFDPYANVISVVHRGTAALGGTGTIWWNNSYDGGATYTQSTTSVQNGMAPNNGRYPSMCLSNPTKGTDVASVSGVFSWPQLVGGAFGGIGYGVATDLMTSDFSAEVTGDPLYSSQVPCWADDMSAYVFWVSDYSVDGNAGSDLYRTNDWATIEKIVPTQWNSAAFGDNGGSTCGGVAFNGVQYYGMVGSFDDTVIPNAWVGVGGWGIGYSKSTDQGATWSDYKTVDWSAISATAKYDRLWDYNKGDGNTISITGDINVDKNGMVHLVTGLTDIDSAVSTDYGYNAIVEFIETEAGWDAKIIAEGDALWDSTFTQQDGPGLGQMGFSVYLATNVDRDVFVAQYVTSNVPGDSLCDIFMNYRKLDGDYLPEPMNLTQTPGMNENGSHLAPIIKKTGENSYEAYSMYYYETGFTGAVVDPVAPHDIYIAAVPFVISGVEDEISANYSFNLAQNYPNPFNPTTTIKYSVPENSFVTLKVYDILGNEVATLVNQTMTAGSHNVNFNAANLASGMYVYKMQAGNFQNVKKMMLLK